MKILVPNPDGVLPRCPDVQPEEVVGRKLRRELPARTFGVSFFGLVAML